MIDKENKTKIDLSYVLFGLAIVVLPFNALPYFTGIFKEMAGEGTFYPILIGMLIFFIKQKKVYIPKEKNTCNILILFVGWILLSGLFNIADISAVTYKGKMGYERFFSQLILVVFVISASIWIYNASKTIPHLLMFVRKMIYISFLIAGTYSLLELGFFINNDLATEMLSLINLLIRDPEKGFYFMRIRSVSGEASMFAMYCSVVFPWILSFVFTERKNLLWYTFLTIYLLILVFLSLSRTGYVIILIQIVVFYIGLFFGRNQYINHKRILLLILCFFIVCIPVFLLLDESFKNIDILNVFNSLLNSDNTSNQTRYGSQVAALNMASDNLLFGVGLGQYGFYMPKFIPDWASNSIEIIMLTDAGDVSTWPSVFNIHARIIAEMGVIGLMIWLTLWGYILKLCLKRYLLNNFNYGRDLLGLALIVSIIGALLSGFTFDSFRFFGYWVLLGISWKYIETN